MKNKIFIAVFVLFTLLASTSFAQYNPNFDDSKLVTAGFGVSGWGIPVFVRYEQAVADNITAGGDLSFQRKSYVRWIDTYYGVNIRASYHFNELLDAPDEWDFYGGASLGVYFGRYKYIGPGNGLNSNGVRANISGHVGARYFVSENLAVTAELGGGSAFSGGTIGVTFIL